MLYAGPALLYGAGGGGGGGGADVYAGWVAGAV